MDFEDKNLQCSDCGTSFVFSAGEQAFFESKGYTNTPKRCPSCREARRAQRAKNGEVIDRPAREMFRAVCAACSKDTEVPFEPREGRPVYCRECYLKMRPTVRPVISTPAANTVS